MEVIWINLNKNVVLMLIYHSIFIFGYNESFIYLNSQKLMYSYKHDRSSFGNFRTEF